MFPIRLRTYGEINTSNVPLYDPTPTPPKPTPSPLLMQLLSKLK